MFKQNQTEVLKKKRSRKLLDFNKCLFHYCENGVRNGHILFRLPVNPRRQRAWLDVIDNPLLEKYSGSYLTARAGICKYHFHPSDFTNPQQKKLHQCVLPLKFNQERSDNFHAGLLNRCAYDLKRNDSSSKMITDIDDDTYTNKLNVRDFANEFRAYLACQASPINNNNENAYNFVTDAEMYNSSKALSKQSVICDFKSSKYTPATNLNSKPESLANYSAPESKCNIESDFLRKAQEEISIGAISDDASTSKQSNKEISVLKEQNVIYKQKVSVDAKLKREKLHHYIKLMNDRKICSVYRKSSLNHIN